MSSKILGNVWDACAAYGEKGAKLMIMARLADYSNDDGVCYPGVETICRQLGLGESTCSGVFDPSDSGKNTRLTLQNLTPDPQGLKHEPPVNSKHEPQDIGASADASAPARSARQEYSPEFEQAWQEYPKRAGGNSKSAAFKAWKARIREGIKPETMLDGVKRYAAWVRATGNTGTQFVKQAATFFGPDRHFEDYWQQPAAHGGGRQRQVDVLAGLGAMSDKFGKSSNKLTF